MKCGISGPVTFNVASGSSYTEQVIIPTVSGTSSTNTIKFNGNGANISYLSTSSSERAIIKLKGTDYVTIDSLNITATGTADNEFGYGIQLVDNADHNTISRCVINVTTSPVTVSSSNFAGIVINSSTAATPGAPGNSQCDSNTIIGNTIIGGNLGISMIANGIINSISGNVIKNNVVQDFYSYGIYLNGNYNAVVEGNDISRPTRVSIGTFYGVFTTTGNVGFKISKNRIHDPFTGNATSTSNCYGVYTASSDGVDGNENIISNNMIYAINNIGSQYAFYNTGSNFIKYYYNSILLDGPATSTTTYATRGFYQSTTDTAVEFVNNIVSITRPATGPVQAIYISPTIINFMSDHNNFNIATTTGTVNSVGYFNGIQYATLADWKTGSLKDSNSISADPLFVSATDLHIQTASPCAGVGLGLGNVPTDIDGETRPATNTDMGADEIGAIVPVTLKGIAAVIARQNATVNWSTAAELNLNRFEVERSLDGSRFANAGAVAAIAAGTNYSFTDYEIVNKVAANTVIYYRLKMIDRDGKYKYSVVVTVKTGNNNLVSVYPNPFMKELFVKMNAEKTGNVNIKLADQTGRLVTSSSKTVLSGSSILSIPVSDKIASGTYILSIEMGGENYNFKVVK